MLLSERNCSSLHTSRIRMSSLGSALHCKDINCIADLLMHRLNPSWDCLGKKLPFCLSTSHVGAAAHTHDKAKFLTSFGVPVKHWRMQQRLQDNCRPDKLHELQVSSGLPFVPLWGFWGQCHNQSGAHVVWRVQPVLYQRCDGVDK